MIISTKGRYGLKAMIDLYQFGQKESVSLKHISDRQKISLSYLEHIIADLKKSGYVKSTRGAKGGYKLTDVGLNISVGDILRALEGELVPVDCAYVSEDKQCENPNGCPSRIVWEKINDSIHQAVDFLYIRDLLVSVNFIND